MWVYLTRPTPGHGLPASSLGFHASPISKPPLAECVDELDRIGGFSARAARQLCLVGQDRQWFTATITNPGDVSVYPSCRGSAFDHRVRRVFRGGIVLTAMRPPTGPSIPAHSSITVTWYLPREVERAAASIVGGCRVVTNPPV